MSQKDIAAAIGVSPQLRIPEQVQSVFSVKS